MSQPANQITIGQALEHAITHHQAGRLADAEVIYRQVLSTIPDHPDALHLLGVLALQVGQAQAAVDLIQRAIRINPNIGNYHRNLGRSLAALGNTEASIESYRTSAALAPDDPEISMLLGEALRSAGKFDEAVKAFQAALKHRPDWAEVHVLLGMALQAKGHSGSAIASFCKAIDLQPTMLQAHTNLAAALHSQGGLEEAANHYQKAISLQPTHAETHGNLGVVLQDQGRLDQAITHYRHAISLRPNLPSAHYNLGIALLTKGDLPHGLPEYEWRFKVKHPDREPLVFPSPSWDGRQLGNDQRLLLHAEQGLGDTMQMIRYLPLIAQRTRRLIVACQPSLLRLLQQSFDGIVEQWCAAREEVGKFDVQCPMMSLPLAFQTTLATILASVPYLRADPNLAERWRERLSQERSAEQVINVGLVWAGRSDHPRDHLRSIQLEMLDSLADIPNVRFVSLQKTEHKHRNSSRIRLVDWADELHDFADTAALIDNLDVVISVDTAVAHLAGAMGKAVWILLPFGPDWRWLLDRSDTPWYPTMRLFRQPRIGDWQTPIDELTQMLRSWKISVK